MIDFRGMGPPQQAAAQLPPSLLQMAQGQAPQLSGDDRGSGLSSFSANDIPFGAEVRPITSPQDQNWSDAQGRPIHVGGKPPAYNPGQTFGGYNAIFDERAPTTNGGWFTMEDYYKQAPTPMEAAGWGPQDAGEGRGSMTSGPTGRSGGLQSPQVGPRNSVSLNNALSTNNWRLIPGGTPDNFMINGTLVSRAKARGELLGSKIMGQEGGGFPGYWPMGTGIWGTPVSSHGWTQGYIGGDGWGMTSTPTY